MAPTRRWWRGLAVVVFGFGGLKVAGDGTVAIHAAPRQLLTWILFGSLVPDA